MNVMFLRKIKESLSTTLEMILADQLHSTKIFSHIAQSLIRESTTDAVTRKNISTNASLFKKDMTTDVFIGISLL